MPTIDKIDGIKINIYNGEHRPPHLHACYNEFEVLLEIESSNIYAGDLPNKQLKKNEKTELNFDFYLSFGFLKRTFRKDLKLPPLDFKLPPLDLNSILTSK